jgi:hypothetical protein
MAGVGASPTDQLKSARRASDKFILLIIAMVQAYAPWLPGVWRRVTARRWRYGVMLALGFAYVCFSQHRLVGVLADAGLDDALFVRGARALVDGQWLGAYSNVTLAKGPGYTFFLALNALLGTSIILLQSALYAFSCAVFTDSIFRLSRSSVLSLTMFAVLLWHPLAFPVHIVRDDIYGAQSLLYVGCLIRLVLREDGHAWRRFWAVATGLAFAWLWVTREEGVWVIPPTILLCAPGLWASRSRWMRLALFPATAALILALIATANLAAYGTFTIVDFKGRAYSKAVAALQSVRVGSPEPYVPVPARVREAVYQVSPAFRSLKGYFDGPGRGFTQFGCPFYPNSCGDYAGGWFIWAFRDGVAQAGHYGSSADAAAFYDQITSEVRKACDSGRLHCVTSSIPFMPAVTSAQLSQIPSKVRRAVEILTARAGVEPTPDSSGAAAELETTWEFDGYPRRMRAESDPPGQLMGWYYAKSGSWIELACQAYGRTQIVPVARRSSQDIASHFKDDAAGDRRFSITFPPGATCRVRPAGSPDAGFSYLELSRQPDWQLGGGQMHIDKYGSGDRTPLEDFARRALGALLRLYKRFTPLLIVGAIAGYLAHAVMLLRRSARLDGYWLFVHALWLAVAGRCAILILVDISSFPAVTPTYLAATAPLVYAALLLMAWLPLQEIISRRAKPSGQAAQPDRVSTV